MVGVEAASGKGGDMKAIEAGPPGPKVDQGKSTSQPGKPEKKDKNGYGKMDGDDEDDVQMEVEDYQTPVNENNKGA